jgi:hypothetical protein
MNAPMTAEQHMRVELLRIAELADVSGWPVLASIAKKAARWESPALTRRPYRVRKLYKFVGYLPCSHIAAGVGKCIPGDEKCARSMARELLEELVPVDAVQV